MWTHPGRRDARSPLSDNRPHDWKFLELAAALTDAADTRIDRLLEVASKGLLKIWDLSITLRVLKLLFLVLVGSGFIAAIVFWHNEPLFSPKGIASALGVLGLAFVLGKFGLAWILKLFNIRKTAHQILVGVGLSVAGWLGTWLHILIFDRMYLRKGEVHEKQNS